MGTRGFTGWKIDGKVVITYQQFDSYPSGVGADLAGQLVELQTEIANGLTPPELARAGLALIEQVRVELRRRFADVEVVSDETGLTDSAREKLTAAGSLVTDVSTGDDLYAWTRGTQGSVAKILAAGVAYHYGDEWPHDSVFCEWGYLLNFDADEGLGRFEVYKGFQQARPAAGEWAGQDAPLEDTGEWVGQFPDRKWVKTGEKRSEYFPVNLVKWYSLVPPPNPTQLAGLERELHPENYADA